MWKNNRATELASAGLLGKAARVLERENMPLPPNVGALLQQLHPKCNEQLPTHTSEPAIVAVDPERLLAVMKQQASLKSPGPSSWTEDLLFQAANQSEECLALLSTMVKDIANGTVPPEVADVVRSCRLIAIPKSDTAVRPIAIGESIVKIAEAYVMRVGGAPAIETLRPEQSAFDPAGCVGRHSASQRLRPSFSSSTGRLRPFCTQAGQYSARRARDKAVYSARSSSASRSPPQ